MTVQLTDFGRDHWSLMAYVETCCVEGGDRAELSRQQNQLSRDRMRGNEHRHPMLKGWRNSGPGHSWEPTWGTRLKGHTEATPRRLDDHDDWDCLDDLEGAGLVEIVSLANSYVFITERGLAVAQEIRLHKTTGGQFANFTPSAESLAKNTAAIVPA